MENKINGKISADSTDSRISDLFESGYGRASTKLTVDSLSCMSSVRNFGNAGASIHSLNSGGDCVFKDCTVIDAGKQFYGRNSEYLKSENAEWDDFVKVQQTVGAASESLPGASLSLSATSAACKLIKDEKEPSAIMDTPGSSFDPSPEISSLDICCDTDRKQHLGLGENEPAGFPPATAVPRPGMEGSPSFLIDLNQSGQLVSPVRTDSRCVVVGKTVINFDNNAQAAAQQVMYKTEGSRWQMQTSPAEPQYWCQSAGVTEDPFTPGCYDGIQNQNLSQRTPSTFSTFPG